MLKFTGREYRGYAAGGAILFMVLGFWGCRATQGASSPVPALAPTEAKAAEAEVMVAAKGGDAPDDEKPAPAPSAPPAEEQAEDENPQPAMPEETPDGDAAKKAAPIVIHVSGAVKRPGVYTLKTGDRIYHAVRAAGGFKTNAWQEGLNLADTLQDADQIVIPTKEEMGPPSPVRAGVVAAAPVASEPAPEAMKPISIAITGKPRPHGRVVTRQTVAPPPAIASAPPVSSPLSAPGFGVGRPVAPPAKAPAKPGKFKNPGDGMVNINTATASELQKLPGVGPAMSERILAYRLQIGQFQDPAQLMDVKGIGEKTFAKMQPFVVVR